MDTSMREPTFLILVALADAERHGYGIIREVEELSEGRLKLGPGSLYGALDRLSEQNLIRSTRTEVVNGRLRRYYAINDAGRIAVREEATRRSAVLQAAESRLGLAST
ncbi:MAG TPA: PadR family transcriptional regulator [Acidimicrobiales bacterium]|nr:PadR family transcriptional regulator [Acidimicrobiales bacterium]